MESHLLQMRGLKHLPGCRHRTHILSHLLQMRGLKPLVKVILPVTLESHLLQMRGLKRFEACLVTRRNRRIFYRCVD